MLIKKMLNKIICHFISIKNGTHISFHSNVSYKSCSHFNYGVKIINAVEISDKVYIGKYSSINGPGTRIYAKLNNVMIGNFCSIAGGVVIQEYNHKIDRLSSSFISQNLYCENYSNDITSKGNIIIEDDVWIGANSIILSGIRIGRGSIIGAGSVVTKDIPKYSIAVGNPAKVIKMRFSQENIEYIEKLEWWKWDLSKIQENKYLFTTKISEIQK